MDSAGRAFTVWQRSVDGGVVEGRTQHPGGTLGPVETIAPAPAAATAAAVAPMPSGGTLVLWVSTPDDGRPSLNTRVRASNGTLSAPQTIATATELGSFAMATNADGQAVVAWAAQGTDGAFSIYARMRSASGALSPIRRLSYGGAARPAVAIGPAGDAIVAWTRSDGTDYRVAASRLSADGVAGTSTWQSATGANASQPAVAIGADGTAHLAFVRDGQLLLRSRPPAGAFGTARPLSVAGTSAAGPRLAAAPDGPVELAWLQDCPSGPTADVLARTLNADSTLSPTQELGAGRRDFIGNSPVRLAAGSQGRSAVTWWTIETDQVAVRVRRRTATTLAAPERIRLTPNGVACRFVATTATGQVAATWNEGVPETDTQSGYSQVLGRTSGP